MNSGLRIGRAAGALAAAAWLLASPASAATKQVSANASNTFAPATVDVTAGDTVKWTNVGGLGHTVTSSSSNWTKDDRITTTGDSTSYRFTKAGTFRYV